MYTWNSSCFSVVGEEPLTLTVSTAEFQEDSDFKARC